MAGRLTWDRLLSEDRTRMDSGKAKDNPFRNEFEADYDRIVGSSSVRRLQDKAQVFPLQENDFTRTRLTHSVEVSALARSLGKAVGKELEKIDAENFTAEKTEKLASLLQVAGLIHDLGNPPFGHYGETVIREWFKRWFENDYKIFERTRANLKDQVLLNQQEKNDFIFFDGNVQNLRIVTKLQTLNDEYGANFTYGTLSTIIKYPWSSVSKEGADKFGYFASEGDIIQKLWEKTGLSEGIRHPATYLLEAADDIIYICDDIEDGVKKGYICWKDEYTDLQNKFKEQQCYVDLFHMISSKKTDDNMDVSERTLAQVRNFRNIVQTYLFMKAKEKFIISYDKIMNGEFRNQEILVDETKFIKALKDITKRNCFGCQEVLELELVGDKVLKTLLDIFVPTILNSTQEEIDNTKIYAGKLYKIISSNFKYIARHDYWTGGYRKFNDIPIYDKLHLVVDYISGMTDSYAVNLYKKLLGIELP